MGGESETWVETYVNSTVMVRSWEEEERDGLAMEPMALMYLRSISMRNLKVNIGLKVVELFVDVGVNM